MLAIATPVADSLGTVLDRRQSSCSQCSPYLTPGDNSQQCDGSTVCVYQPGFNYYCACRGGYKADEGDYVEQVGLEVLSSAFVIDNV